MTRGCGIPFFRFALSLAAPVAVMVIQPLAAGESTAASVSEELDAEAGYAGGATTRGGGANLGSIDEWKTALQYVISPQINRRLFLRFGVRWQRIAFGVPEHSPVPRELDQIGAIVGFDWQASDNWLLRAELQPGVYSDFRSAGWRSVDAPLLAGAVYIANADLQWMFGLRVVPRSEYPVLPVAGVRWKFADPWTLNLLMPNPRLEYDLNDRLKAWLGADLTAGTYAVGDRFGTDIGKTALNHATLDFFELRAGAGIVWKIKPNLSLEASAGCMAYRSFSFFDHDLIERSRPAPYFQIAGHWQF